MTAEVIRDIRTAILRELYRIDPRGRNVRGLFTMIYSNVPSAQPEDVQEQARFLNSQGYIHTLPVDPLAASDEAFYVISAEGCTYCESKRLV